MMSGAQTPPIKAANCLLVSESVNKIKVNNTSYQYKEQYLLSRLSIKVKAAIVGLLRLASYADDSSRSSRYLSLPRISFFHVGEKRLGDKPQKTSS